MDTNDKVNDILQILNSTKTQRILILEPREEIVNSFGYSFDIKISYDDKTVKMTIPNDIITWSIEEEFPEDIEILLDETEQNKLRTFLDIDKF